MSEKPISLKELSINIPAVEFDTPKEEVNIFFSQNDFLDYVVVLKDNKPIGILYKSFKEKFLDEDCLIGDFITTLPLVKDRLVPIENILDLITILNLKNKPALIVDNKDNYLGVLTREVVLYYIYKEEIIEASILKLSQLFEKEAFLLILGIDNIKSLNNSLKLTNESCLFKILKQLTQSLLNVDKIIIKEEKELWCILNKKPLDDVLNEFCEKFYNEFNLLYRETDPPKIYGIIIDLKTIKDYSSLLNKISNFNKKIEIFDNPLWMIDDLQPRLNFYRQKKEKDEIVEKIKNIFDNIVKALENSEKELWEYVLYDKFKEYSFFELFYIINEKGMQISNNILNTALNRKIVTGRKGSDRSSSSYFKNAIEKGYYITPIYLSSATGDFCITISKKFIYKDKTYVLAGDINYQDILKIV